MPQEIQRLSKDTSALIVIDMQERLLPVMFEPQRVIDNVVRLIRGASLLHLPTLMTEQYKKGLGATVPQVAAAAPELRPLEKISFSAMGASGFLKALRSKNVRSVVLCGVEAHVCVSQTCLDLLENGIHVFVAQDATSSRTPENWRLSADRMNHAGAVIASTEMVLFELLRSADSPQFRQMLEIVK